MNGEYDVSIDRYRRKIELCLTCIWYMEHFTVGCDEKQNNDM